MNIGDIEVFFVSDGLFRTEPQGPFGLVPRANYEKIYKPDKDFTVPLALTSLVVKSEGKVILIDTGLGDKLKDKVVLERKLSRPNGGLINNLSALNIQPEDIDIVINTHLHDDHCGWNTCIHDGELVPTFPRATYLVQRIEWVDACHPNARTKSTYFPENFSSLMTDGRMQVLHGDTPVTENVKCVVTPGHTRGHQSILLSTGNWRGLFVSDMATYAVHFERSAWVTAYDVEPLVNIATKERWQPWAIENNAWLFFYHDLNMPIARLKKWQEHLEIQSITDAKTLIDSLP